MQQIGRKAVASAIVVDPRRVPVPLRPRRKQGVFALANRNWVLHRQLIVRALVAMLCAALIAGAFQSRGGVTQAMYTLGDIMQGEFASAGLGISAINITGQSVTGEGLVLGALDVGEHTSIIEFDAEAARQRLLALPAVDDASVRKIYPNGLVVSIVEKTPVARWRLPDGTTALIDSAGTQIGTAQPVDTQLPLVIGEGAADDAFVLLRALQSNPQVTGDVVALSRIADRRWDLIFKSGLRVQLPERGIAQALRSLAEYQETYQLLDRDISLVDLRVTNILAVRLNETAEKTGGAG